MKTIGQVFCSTHKHVGSLLEKDPLNVKCAKSLFLVTLKDKKGLPLLNIYINNRGVSLVVLYR